MTKIVEGLPARVAAWMLFGLLSIAQVVSAEGPTAREVVQNTSDGLLNLIEEARSYVDEDPEQFYVAVEALLSPVVDFAGFARNVMAVHFKKATIDQRRKFTDNFKWGLVRSYSLALTGFSEGEIVLVPRDRPPRSPKRESVKMEIRTPTGETYPLVYSMALGKDQVWRVRNIIVNGVNLGLTYRNQFASAATDNKYGGDLDAVIEGWANVLQSDAKEKLDAAAEDVGAGAEDDGANGELAADDEAGL